MVQEQSPAEVRRRMKENETFVVNVVAAWCPDCTERQEPNFPEFVRKMKGAGVAVYQCSVQVERLVFISAEHEALTDEFGGHGYPRTVLIKKGIMMDSRVEVMDPLALAMLADEYVAKVQAG
jgi:thiol-disulfide isomerase/thioredoxin